MGSIEREDYGVVRFTVPDTSLSAHDRAIFTLPANKSYKDERVKLHDIRTAPGIYQGLEGLDTHGFTYVKHRSALSGDDWFAEGKIEDVYIPELEDLILKATGAKKAVVYCVAFRRRLPVDIGVGKVELRGGEMDQFVGCLSKSKCLVSGRDAYSTEPSRQVHIDISPQGLFDTLQSCRRDIMEAAQPVIQAAQDGTPIPRYGAFSVWRPIKTVKRDPIVVCDSRTNDKSELETVDFRALSEITDSSTYSMQAVMGLPPKRPELQKWHWIPEQTPEEVLMIKFADSAAADDTTISGGALHTSAIVEGTEDEEVRESVEARIYVFW